jgi:5-oxoprolinase (ATP-hydrolysing) subunit C
MSMYTFEEAGHITTVQGIPFRGFRHLGMPLVGAADPVSLALANWMVGNAAETQGYEIALSRVRIKAFFAAHVAVAGAVKTVLLDGERVLANRSFVLTDGQTLEILPPEKGCRSYLATCGGVPCAKMLGASSTYAPFFRGGSEFVPDGYGPQGLTYNSLHQKWEERTLPKDYSQVFGDHFLLRYVDGPESHLAAAGPHLLEVQWTVGQRANRMGLQLEGEALSLASHEELWSSAVFPGTIQCPPSGLPFLLGPDAQTTGGYPRIAQVIRADRHLIGQLRPGARVRFQRIEPAEAQRLYRSKIALIRQSQPDFRLD